MASRFLRTVVALFCLATLATVSFHPISAAEAGIPEALAIHKASDLRIMVLGDSITAGILGGGGATTDGGYRGRLAQLLAADGYHATFVGGRDDFASKMPALRHEGWPGYVIRATSKGAPGQLLGPLIERALTKYDPDLILLMAGTNDLLRYEADDDQYSQSEIVESMDLLLRQIYRLRPHVRVILAGIVDSPKVPQCMIERFDMGANSCEKGDFPNLRSLAEQYAAAGYPVLYAGGMFDALPRDAKHFPDGIHPAAGAGGYDAVADVWHKAIMSITPGAAETVGVR
jgi:lysophospholipase L1-like esterase